MPYTFEQTKASILTALRSTDISMADIATVCYETGARIGDALNIEAWEYNSETRRLEYRIEKTSQQRVFNLPKSALITEKLLTGALPMPYRKSYAAYTYLFSIAKPAIQPVTGKQDCTYHFGRYYCIRQLNAAGLTPVEIMNYLGGNSLPTVWQYINRVILDKRTRQPIIWG